MNTRRLKRSVGILLALLLLWPGFPGRAGALSLQDSGNEVLKLKHRLFDLGYLSTIKKATRDYTKSTAEAVTWFQELNNLPGTGEADQATLDALYAKEAIKAPLPEDRPFYDTAPDSVMNLPPHMLPTDDRGFLLPGQAPYVFKDRAQGLWQYVSDTMKVEISRFTQATGSLEWFEVFIAYRDGGMPRSIESAKECHRLQQPLDMLMGHEDIAVAITDDYYVYRVHAKEKVGVVVRDGVVMADDTVSPSHGRFPSLEVLALFSDGRLQTFDSNAHTGLEYIAQGVTDTWAFGPTLVSDGEVPRYFYSKDYHSYREPRCALGMVAPGTYCALVVTGRKDESHGATFGWMAEKMREMGAMEALNLDGGGTAALVFQGEILNHSVKNQTSRAESGMIGFAD